MRRPFAAVEIPVRRDGGIVRITVSLLYTDAKSLHILDTAESDCDRSLRCLASNGEMTNDSMRRRLTALHRRLAEVGVDTPLLDAFAPREHDRTVTTAPSLWNDAGQGVTR